MENLSKPGEKAREYLKKKQVQLLYRLEKPKVDIRIYFLHTIVFVVVSLLD